ncbi:hypothetical protein BVRB_9g219170 [Beta vulgaris subsp. vulgaris]|nr:hypothetical protein BVRB_9g219170 [Beta vulgaris subsp. vulgaris]
METQVLSYSTAEMETYVSSLLEFLKVEAVLVSLQTVAFVQRILLFCLTTEHVADNELLRNKWISLSHKTEKTEDEAKDANFSGDDGSDDEGNPEEDTANGAGGTTTEKEEVRWDAVFTLSPFFRFQSLVGHVSLLVLA